jgi:glutamate synthase domain-containing protein 3
VFALYEGKVQIGLIASEKQAIDAALESLAASDERIGPVADRYWNARGGSHTDGGAFLFTVQQNGRGRSLSVTDKFGQPVTMPLDQVHNNPSTATISSPRMTWLVMDPSPAGPVLEWIVAGTQGVQAAWQRLSREIQSWTYGELTWFCQRMVALSGAGGDAWEFTLGLLTMLRDRYYDPGAKRRASVLALVDKALVEILDGVPLFTSMGSPSPGSATLALDPVQQRRVDWPTRSALRAPLAGEVTLALHAGGFPSEGDDSAARLIVEAARLGWRNIVAYGWRGGRFCACGLGPGGAGVRIAVYGSSGDYLGSGLQGAEVHVHGSAQDQVGQILKDGKLVIHGDVGQTFMYGAKGGEAYVLGNAAGRPLINAAGCPRVVINGTCLDYLAESFMAGDPLVGGGLVVLNGVTFDAHGQMVPQPTPYPGGNLFSLASGGAIYVRDPHHLLSEDQLNGGAFAPLTEADWALIAPYLEENERLFGIRVEALLTVLDKVRRPEEVYRKVAAVRLQALT